MIARATLDCEPVTEEASKDKFAEAVRGRGFTDHNLMFKENLATRAVVTPLCLAREPVLYPPFLSEAWL